VNCACSVDNTASTVEDLVFGLFPEVEATVVGRVVSAITDSVSVGCDVYSAVTSCNAQCSSAQGINMLMVALPHLCGLVLLAIVASLN